MSIVITFLRYLGQPLSFFDSLPEAELKKLASKIESDRHTNKFGIPHDAIMALLRPSLSIIRAPRILTPQRALCEPFEDNLVNKDSENKEDGQIARASIAAMVEWLKNDLIPNEYAELSAAFEVAQEKHLLKEAKVLTHHLWQQSAAALISEIGDSCDGTMLDQQIVAQFGGEKHAMDIRDMATFLEIARHVESLREELAEKPIDDLLDPDVLAVSGEYEKVADKFPGRENFLLLSVMGRLTKPFPIVKVVKEIAANGDTDIMNSDLMGAAGNMLFTALEDEAATAFKAISDNDIPETTVARKIKQFSDSYQHMADELQADKDSDFGERLHKTREAVCKVVENRILNNVEDTVLAALSDADHNLVVDLSDWPDEADFAQSEQRAMALADTMRVSEQLGIYGACLSKANGLRKQLKQHGEDIIQNLRSVKEDGIGIAGAHLATAVRLLEIIAGPEEADDIRQRGETELMAAMAKAPKAYAL